MPLCATQEALLSSLKQESLRLQKEKNSLESDVLEFNWINPIMGSYTDLTSDQLGFENKTRTYAITLEQPIFKSGGIYYAMKYANANRTFLELSVALEEKGLLKEAMNAILQLNKSKKQLEKQEYLLANARIDVMRKKEQFERGLLDSSFLDQALLSLNTHEKALLDLEAAIQIQSTRFASVSDLDPLHVSLPVYEVMNEKRYTEHSLALAKQQAQVKRNEHLKALMITSYLPTLSLVGGYYKTDNDVISKAHNEYVSYGLKLSMPLYDINHAKNIEIRKLEYLQSKVLLEDTKRAEKNFYSNTIQQLEILDKKIVLLKKDATQYDSLLHNTKEGLIAGDKTIYDVQTLENSYHAIVLESSVLSYEKQLLLLELYIKVSGEI